MPDLPIDGYGGSDYNVQFAVPVYNPGSEYVYNTTSWHAMDNFHKWTVCNAVASAVSFGICATTLLNTVVLTPERKRRLPLHSFMCLALMFQVMRNCVDMALWTASVPASSYYSLTFDTEAIVLSRKFYGLVAAGQVSACLSFILVQACFFIQGRALMAWLHIHHRMTYFGILTYLIVGGVTATCLRISIAVFQILYPLTAADHSTFGILTHATLVTYSISIGSWSSIFFVSAISIIVNRKRTMLDRKSPYDMALNVIAVLGLESFIIPILFCIMQLLPIQWVVTKPEQLIIPSALFLLPIGSLFLTVHTNETSRAHPNVPPAAHPNMRSQKSPQNYQSKDVSSQLSAVSHGASQATTLTTSYLPLTTSPEAKPKQVADMFKVELASIDALDQHNPDTPRTKEQDG